MAEGTRAKASKKAAAPHAGGDADDASSETIADFQDAVNMTATRLSRWLETEESRGVGFKGDSGKDSGKESVGHKSGRRIVRLLGKAKDDLTPGDLAHMRKVAGYVHRHLAQRPSGDIADTPWRHSLMNWGHDPLHATEKKR